MKKVSVRLPDHLAAEIEREARRRKLSRAVVIREHLERAHRLAERAPSLFAIADLIGSVDGLPSDLSANKKAYLRATGFGHSRPK